MVERRDVARGDVFIPRYTTAAGRRRSLPGRASWDAAFEAARAAQDTLRRARFRNLRAAEMSFADLVAEPYLPTYAHAIPMTRKNLASHLGDGTGQPARAGANNARAAWFAVLHVFGATPTAAGTEPPKRQTREEDRTITPTESTLIRARVAGPGPAAPTPPPTSPGPSDAMLDNAVAGVGGEGPGGRCDAQIGTGCSGPRGHRRRPCRAPTCSLPRRDGRWSLERHHRLGQHRRCARWRGGLHVIDDLYGPVVVQ